MLLAVARLICQSESKRGRYADLATLTSAAAGLGLARRWRTPGRLSRAAIGTHLSSDFDYRLRQRNPSLGADNDCCQHSRIVTAWRRFALWPCGDGGTAQDRRCCGCN